MKKRARGSKIATPVHAKVLLKAPFADCRARRSKQMTPVHGNVIFYARLGLDAECLADHVY